MTEEKPSGSSPEPPGGDSTSAEALAAADAPSMPVEARCKCGARQHATDPNICERGHTWLGNRRSLTHGRYAEQLVDDDVATVPDRLEVLRQVRAAIIRDLARFAGTGRMRPREQAHALNADDRLADIDARIAALGAEMPSGRTQQASDAEVVRRIARIFTNEPDLFREFLTELITIDRDGCGPLRSQMRLTLDHFEPQGIPRLRGKKDDDPDVVIL